MKKKEDPTNVVNVEDPYHDRENKIDIPLSLDLDVNIKNVNILFENCRAGYG